MLSLIRVALVVVSSQQLNSRRNCYQGVAYCCDRSAHALSWKNMEDLGTRKAVGSFKWGWKGHICRRMEDSAESNLNSGAPAQEPSEGKVISK